LFRRLYIPDPPPSYYEQDGLGSVTSLSNVSGAVANSYVYDAFGNTTASSGTLTSPFQYTGRDYDSETGLRYYRARYYSADNSRFLSEDPVRFEAGTNFYRYVKNRPTVFADPEGLGEKPKQVCFCESLNEKTDLIWPFPKGCFYSCACIPDTTSGILETTTPDITWIFFPKGVIRETCGTGWKCPRLVIAERTRDIVRGTVGQFKIRSYVW